MLDPALAPFGLESPKQCELPCQSTADCLDPVTACVNGMCSPRICDPWGPDGGWQADIPWQACDNSGTRDGTCIFAPYVFHLQNSLLADFFCAQAGTAQGTCAPSATRATPGDLCQAGLICGGVEDGGETCVQGCDLADAQDTCPTGQQCAQASPSPASPYYHFARCYPVGGAGCSEGLSSSQHATCFENKDCGCPQQCVLEPGLGVTVCELPCAQSADCPYADAHCVSGFCRMNFCFRDPLGQSAPGHLGGPCDADGVGDGTCVALGFTPPGQVDPSDIGICVRSGTATTACTQPVEINFSTFVDPGSILPADQLCPQGQFCFNGACAPICDAMTDAGGPGCTGTDRCIGLDDDPASHLGVCGACLAAQAPCFLDSDCCSGTCSTNFTCQ